MQWLGVAGSELDGLGLNEGQGGDGPVSGGDTGGVRFVWNKCRWGGQSGVGDGDVDGVRVS